MAARERDPVMCDSLPLPQATAKLVQARIKSLLQHFKTGVKAEKFFEGSVLANAKRERERDVRGREKPEEPDSEGDRERRACSKCELIEGQGGRERAREREREREETAPVCLLISSGYGATHRDVSAESVFSEAEFAAVFKNHGTQTQPTPSKNTRLYLSLSLSFTFCRLPVPLRCAKHTYTHTHKHTHTQTHTHSLSLRHFSVRSSSSHPVFYSSIISRPLSPTLSFSQQPELHSRHPRAQCGRSCCRFRPRDQGPEVHCLDQGRRAHWWLGFLRRRRKRILQG